MSAGGCSPGQELDFTLVFGEDGQQRPFRPAAPEPDENASFYILNVDESLSVGNQPVGNTCHGFQQHSKVVVPHLQTQKAYDPSCEGMASKYSPMGVAKTFECPSIQITSISPSCQQDLETSENQLQVGGADGECQDQSLSRDHLYLPLDPSYRESSLSPSPCSSLSSRSWFSDASSCESFSHVYDDVDSELNEAAARFTLGSPLGNLAEDPWQRIHPSLNPTALSPLQSPAHSPRTSITDDNWLSPQPPSRPTSPCGKRRHSSSDLCYPGSASPHHSPSPTPGHSPRGSVTEDTWVGSPSPGISSFQCCPSEADIPSKTRKTSQDQSSMAAKCEPMLEDAGSMSPSMAVPVEEGGAHTLKKEGVGEQFLAVPSHFSWSKPKPGHIPIFRTSSLPPLDWPLPNQFGQHELKIEVQPKTHHRAHYETEGSRGAVKAASGGHPVVKLTGYSEKPVNLQMFIGTADDRYLRPHAFYQVHRITGKTVATASQEVMISSTKILEIPLLPENNMSASIDCAGILKLRNSDIELRKGETDIGRKNTRVRLVFRVHVPQSSGKVLSLQVVSIPIECSQRSAQELPQVEKCSLSSCSVAGGEEMVLTGFNFFPESKVIFLEKGSEGRPHWEAEAKVLWEKSHGSSIVLEVPPYHNQVVSSAVHVHFYVCNGKRKRSQCQRFTYLSVLVKKEQRNETDLTESPSMAAPGPVQTAHSLARPQLPSPDHDSLLSSSPHSLVPGLTPPQLGYPPLGPSSLRNMNSIHSHGLGGECHSIHPPMGCPSAPLPPHSAYQSMQQPLRYNGQPNIPLNVASPQAYESVAPFQPDPAFSHSPRLALIYQTSSGLPSAGGLSLCHGSQHLQPLGFHCTSVGLVPATPHPAGQPLPQLQHTLSYQGSSSCPSPASGPPSMLSSPCSDPSSPQAHQLPYQSPTGETVSSPSTTPGSPMMQLPHSGQPSSQPASPGVPAVSAPLGHTLASHSPFQSGEEHMNIKQEPEDKELTFRSIGLQDITLDDGNDLFHLTSLTLLFSPVFSPKFKFIVGAHFNFHFCCEIHTPPLHSKEKILCLIYVFSILLKL
ncbi:nuclear factor of activated T-cells, cytoplasmic 3-like isoform X1 [Arapaima gigas]